MLKPFHPENLVVGKSYLIETNIQQPTYTFTGKFDRLRLSRFKDLRVVIVEDNGRRVAIAYKSIIGVMEVP